MIPRETQTPSSAVEFRVPLPKPVTVSWPLPLLEIAPELLTMTPLPFATPPVPLIVIVPPEPTMEPPTRRTPALPAPELAPPVPWTVIAPPPLVLMALSASAYTPLAFAPLPLPLPPVPVTLRLAPPLVVMPLASSE